MVELTIDSKIDSAIDSFLSANNLANSSYNSVCATDDNSFFLSALFFLAVGVLKLLRQLVI